MISSAPDEGAILQSIAHNLKEASAGCLQLAVLRPEQARLWEKAAALFTAGEGQIWDLATQGMFTADDRRPRQ